MMSRGIGGQGAAQTPRSGDGGPVHAGRLFLVVFVVLGGLAPRAQAEDRDNRVGFIHVSLRGSIPPAARSDFSLAIQAGLALEPLKTQAACRVELLGRGRHLVGCREGPCLQSVGELLGLRVGLFAEATEQMGTYNTVLHVVDLSTGKRLLERTWACEICTLKEAARALRESAAGFSNELRERIAAIPPTRTSVRVSVVTRPDGAQLFLDGVFVGRAPLRKELDPGEYLFSLRKEGYLRSERFIEVGSTPLDVEFRLKPAALLAAPATPLPAPEGASFGSELSGYSSLAFVGLGLGLASTALGAVMMSLDGEQTCDHGPIEKCPTVYDTGGFGIVAAALGGALLAGSAVFFILDEQGSTQPEPAARRSSPSRARSPRPSRALVPVLLPSPGGRTVNGGLMLLGSFSY